MTWVCSHTGKEAWSSENPAWLALPAVHYAMLPGNQQPCFRVALGHTDTRAWLAWEVTTCPKERCYKISDYSNQPSVLPGI